MLDGRGTLAFGFIDESKRFEGLGEGNLKPVIVDESERIGRLEGPRARNFLGLIHDRERPFVEVDVPSREVIKLQVGQTLRLDFAGVERTGRVAFICPQAHNRNGDADSWITVRVHPAGKLWPEVAIGSAVAVRMK